MSVKSDNTRENILSTAKKHFSSEKNFKILVLGAGVLGGNLAMNLFRAGKDVTLLARGDWGRYIEENGLTIRYQYSFKKRNAKIPVIKTLEAHDFFDVIFVTVQFIQLSSVIQLLRENCSQNIVFVGNNTRAEQCAAALPEKNVMFAFASSAGHRDKTYISSIDMKKITIGQLKDAITIGQLKDASTNGQLKDASTNGQLKDASTNGQLNDASTNGQLIKEVFAGTPYRIVYEPNMNDYLLSHAAFVVPCAFACYYTNGSLKKIGRNKEYINRIIRANIEGYSALEKAGHEILPDDVDFRSERYYKICYRLYKLMCVTSLGKICASDHAMNAVEEMSALNEDLKVIFKQAGASFEEWLRLEAEAKYLSLC